MSSSKQVEVQFEDQTPRKWCHPLREDGFAALMSREDPTVHKIFGAGSFFSPLLFGKFFDPSDAFPLWEFDPDSLLPNQRKLDWFQADTECFLKAELPAGNAVQVCVENGKILEISGEWRRQKESAAREWKSGHWWEHGYVRRLELPEQVDWRKSEAQLKNDVVLEIRIPKNATDIDVPVK